MSKRLSFTGLALLLATISTFSGLAYAAARSGDTDIERAMLLTAMKQELERSTEKLKLPDFDKPYFISYQLLKRESVSIQARFGAIFNRTESNDGDLYVEVRVGDYAFDNTGGAYGGFPFAVGSGIMIPTEAPVDIEPSALRASLWLLTDSAYKQALSSYHQKKGKAAYRREEVKAESFSREKAFEHMGESRSFEIDEKLWEKRVRLLSGLLAEQNGIVDSSLRMQAERQERYYVNSEGSRIADERILVHLFAEARAHAQDDMVLMDSRSFYAPGPEALPSMQELEKEILQMASRMLATLKAPVMDPYTGPAILSPQAAAVLFHEAVGHRLEGERLNSDEEGGTFKGRLGEIVLPEFLDVIDDPTLRMHGDEALNGHYSYDNEGQPAGRTVLVRKGRLKGYLMSRTPVEGVDRSNGHGRSSGSRKPMARMGVTIVESHKSIAHDSLKGELIKLVKKQGKPYGLIIDDMEGGSTNTSSYGYQAFKGIPRSVRRVYPDGREERVRGVELVGTPLTSIGKIVLTGDRAEVFNGYCGAESGYIPVSAIAPAMLVGELEVQRKRQEKERPPILPKP